MTDRHDSHPDRGTKRPGLLFPFPWAIAALLVPCWIFWLVMNRDRFDTEHLLFYYIPDLFRDPLRLLINLTITPLVNTETDQILLITALLGTFGVAIERRFGPVVALALFWGTSAAGAVLGGVLWHLLYPLFPAFEPIAMGGIRVFNGASAGGFGLMAGYAAMARRPWIWILLFCLWEPAFLVLVSQDFTSAFHVIAFITGFATVRLLLRRRSS